jgi:hypothetical protein
MAHLSWLGLSWLGLIWLGLASKRKKVGGRRGVGGAIRRSSLCQPVCQPTLTPAVSCIKPVAGITPHPLQEAALILLIVSLTSHYWPIARVWCSPGGCVHWSCHTCRHDRRASSQPGWFGFGWSEPDLPYVAKDHCKHFEVCTFEHAPTSWLMAGWIGSLHTAQLTDGLLTQMSKTAMQQRQRTRVHMIRAEK